MQKKEFKPLKLFVQATVHVPGVSQKKTVKSNSIEKLLHRVRTQMYL